MKKIINLFSVLSCIALIVFFHIVKTINLKASFENEEKIYSTATLEDEFANDRVLIVLKKNILKSYTIEDFYGVADNVRELTSSTSVNNRVLCLQLKERSKQNVLNIINQLIEREDVVYAGPDYRQKIETISTEYLNEKSASNWASSVLKLAECSEFTSGTNQISVGIIDTGIDVSHNDLNSITDLELSCSFNGGNTYEDDGTYDLNGHGTHVAGIVTQVSPNLKLVSLKVINSDDEIYSSDVANAIRYAITKDIDVLNLSIRWYINSPHYDYALDTVVATYPGIIVCGAGNEGINNDGNNPAYPASLTYNNIISVGAIDSNYERAIFNESQSSNYGEDSVDIFAPGKNILSTYPLILYDSENDDSEGYRVLSGTSMAAPFVTGVVALLLSINPNLTVTQIKTAILESAMIPNINGENPIEGLCVTDGVLNAYSAVTYVLENYPEHEFTLNNINNTIIANENMTSGDNYFYNNNLFYKLNINTSGSYDFELTLLGDATVKLYNEDFIEISINDSNSTNNIIEITKNLSVGTYYLRAYYNNENLTGTIYCNIQGPHTHEYSYSWKNYYQHRTSCSCGFLQNEAHIISSSSNNIIGQYAKCVLCGGDVKTGLVGINNNSINSLSTINGGSFVLPNGVLVLTNDDIDAYFRGELDITTLKKVKVKISDSDIVIYNKKEEEYYE